MYFLKVFAVVFIGKQLCNMPLDASASVIYRAYMWAKCAFNCKCPVECFWKMVELSVL